MQLVNAMRPAQVAEQQRGGPSLAAGCVRAFQGVSPSLVADLCGTAGVSASDSPAALSDGQWAALHGAWLAWLERVQSGELCCRCVTASSWNPALTESSLMSNGHHGMSILLLACSILVVSGCLN